MYERNERDWLIDDSPAHGTALPRTSKRTVELWKRWIEVPDEKRMTMREKLIAMIEKMATYSGDRYSHHEHTNTAERLEPDDRTDHRFLLIPTGICYCLIRETLVSDSEFPTSCKKTLLSGNPFVTSLVRLLHRTSSTWRKESVLLSTLLLLFSWSCSSVRQFYFLRLSGVRKSITWQRGIRNGRNPIESLATYGTEWKILILCQENLFFSTAGQALTIAAIVIMSVRHLICQSPFHKLRQQPVIQWLELPCQHREHAMIRRKEWKAREPGALVPWIRWT